MSRKRVVKKKQVAPTEIKSEKVPPLMESEGRFFQELVNASNRYTNLLKQEAQYKFVAKKLETDRKKIQQGEIKLPILMTLIPKIMSYQESDKKKVLKIFDEQIAAYNTNILSLKGQLEHRYEDYMESAARNKEFLDIRFKSAKAKNIVSLRDVGEKDEEVLFQAQFNDLIKDADKQKELKIAHKEAVKKNVARKRKT
jgi:hypothetical protein